MKINILGVRIDALRKDELLHAIRNKLVQNQQVFIVTPYSESIVAAQTDHKFREVLNAADFALPDGIGILWAARYLSLRGKFSKAGSAFWQLGYSLLAIVFCPRFIRNPIPEKISGSEFIRDLAKLADEKQHSIFLLGGFSGTPQKVAQKLLTYYPNLKIARTFSGSPEEQGIVEKINRSGADFLFTAFGPRRQEEWLSENRKTLNARLLIGLGGTFDYLAGIWPPAPNFWARRGLEWLWRLLTQPWRLGRILKGVWGLICYCFIFRLRKI